ncbi:MAG TPA: hypothetical protein VNK89_07230 [Thermoflexus sp.]|nr:hypothetical protein [Thermoflexus sp.]
MAFTVEDFQDLLALLREHPDWRQQLWALLASEELLRLPGEVKAFREEFRVFRDETFAAFRKETEERFRQVEAQIAALAEAQRRHYEEFAAYRAETERRFAELREEVTAARAEADRRFAELAEAQRRTEERVGRLEEAVERLAEAQRRHYEEFAAHRQEFLAYRVEADRRFAELAEAQRRTEERVGRLEEAVERLAEAQRRHYEEFAAHRVETDRRFAELAEAQRRHYEEFVALRREFQEHRREFELLKNDVGILKDNDLRRRYGERAAAYFGRPDFRRIRVLSAQEVTEALRRALRAKAISPEAFEDARLTDIVIQGRRKGRPLYLVLEVSWVVDRADVERAVRRAEIFQKVLGEVWPGVAGARFTEGARALLQQMKEAGQPIVVAQDGQVDWPGGG